MSVVNLLTHHNGITKLIMVKSDRTGNFPVVPSRTLGVYQDVK